MKEIERIINPFVNAICSYHIDDQEFCENLRKDEVELAKAIEQYVIKARIEELDHKELVAISYANEALEQHIIERIAELKKGLK